MNSFQLDECFNDRRLADRCNQEKKCLVRRWPEARSGEDDDVWFPALLTADAPILTTDFVIALEESNRKALPFPNTGIIVVRPDQPRPGFGSKDASAVIDKVKAIFPDWSATDWSSAYVEFTETGAYVCDFEDEALSVGEHIPYSAASFAEKLLNALAKAKTMGYSRANLIDRN